MHDAHVDGRHEHLTILIVEDHEAVRRSLRTWLGNGFPGAVLLDVSSGEEAVALAAAKPPDLVLMDIDLPEMNGIEATRQIKSVVPQARVVMVTCLDDSPLRLAASAAGASAYVTKQMIQTELIPTIQALRTPPDAATHPAGQLDPAADPDPTAG